MMCASLARRVQSSCACVGGARGFGWTRMWLRFGTLRPIALVAARAGAAARPERIVCVCICGMVAHL